MYSFIPPVYTLKSRILTKSERISWLVIFPLFLTFVTLMMNGSLVDLLLHFFAVMSFYEVGYLFNDFITTQKEENPTLRAGGYESSFYKNFKFHIVIRLLFGLGISGAYLLQDSYGLLLVQVAILITYYFHNTLRSRWNIVSYFFLVTERYLGVVLFIEPTVSLIAVLFCFPICRTLEYACKSKYKVFWLKNIISDIDLFRVKYYLLMLSVSFLLFFSDLIPITYVYLVLYFAVFRVLAYLARNRVKRNKHQAY